MTRQKAFDPQEVIERAMNVFWDQGYEATSVQDLVDAMEINRFSLYATFGDKHGLYLAACDRYCETVTPILLSQLESGDEGLTSIKRFFEMLLEGIKESGTGCLMVNSAVELGADDSEVASRVRAHFLRVERALLAALERAENLGELERCTGLRDHAQHLTFVTNGMLVSLKSGSSHRDARRAVTAALSALPTTI